MHKRVGIYPGSFDPPTKGHIDIISRASDLFDELIVAVGVNSEKVPFLSASDRVESLRECVTHLPSVRVMPFDGLLINFARSQNCRCLVRGLRAITDFDYEFRVCLANRAMAPEIETIFLIASEEFSFLASSVVREVANLRGPYEQFVPEPVAKRIAARGNAKSPGMA